MADGTVAALRREVVDELKRRFVGRDEVVDLIALAVVSGEHLFLYGLPGTAKSALVRQFAAAVAYYPWCPDRAAVGVPTLILIGELDDWAPARACRNMMARRTTLGAPLRLVVYPDAHHAFNLKVGPSSHYGHRLEYNEDADRAAWRETAAALREAFAR